MASSPYAGLDPPDFRLENGLARGIGPLERTGLPGEDEPLALGPGLQVGRRLGLVNPHGERDPDDAFACQGGLRDRLADLVETEGVGRVSFARLPGLLDQEGLQGGGGRPHRLPLPA